MSPLWSPAPFCGKARIVGPIMGVMMTGCEPSGSTAKFTGAAPIWQGSYHTRI